MCTLLWCKFGLKYCQKTPLCHHLPHTHTMCTYDIFFAVEWLNVERISGPYWCNDDYYWYMIWSILWFDLELNIRIATYLRTPCRLFIWHAYTIHHRNYTSNPFIGWIPIGEMITITHTFAQMEQVQTVSISYLRCLIEHVRCYILDRDIELVYYTIRKSSDVLTRDPMQLGAQVNWFDNIFCSFIKTTCS